MTPLLRETPEPTPTALSSLTLAPVWVRELPGLSSTKLNATVAGTPVTVLGQFVPWVKVEWLSAEGPQIVWILMRLITLPEPIPAELVTQVAGS